MKSINTPILRPLSELLRQNLNYIIDKNKFSDVTLELKTGLQNQDNFIQNLKNKSAIIIGSRPQLEKTSLAIPMAFSASVKSSLPILIFSMFDDSENFAMRIISQSPNFDSKNFRNNQIMHPSDFCKIVRATLIMENLPIYFNEDWRLSADEIYNACRAMKGEKNLGLVIIDCLQLIEPDSKLSDEQKINEIMEKFKLLAIDFDCPVIVLSQIEHNNKGQ
jgi:replicative DNA helicase